MSVEHPRKSSLNAPTPEHLRRYHAWGTPVVRDGLAAMIARGDAPPEAANDRNAFHLWSHRGESGEGGSPLHTHPSL